MKIDEILISVDKIELRLKEHPDMYGFIIKKDNDNKTKQIYEVTYFFKKVYQGNCFSDDINDAKEKLKTLLVKMYNTTKNVLHTYDTFSRLSNSEKMIIDFKEFLLEKYSRNILYDLKSEFVKAAQKVYDEWNVDEYDELNGGGICQDIASAIADVISQNDIECSTVSQSSGEQHVYVIAQIEGDGVFIVDINPYTYETGGGYSWVKIPDVIFDEKDIIIDCLSSDSDEYYQFIEE